VEKAVSKYFPLDYVARLPLQPPLLSLSRQTVGGGARAVRPKD